MGIKTYQEKNANAMEKELAQSDIPVKRKIPKSNQKHHISGKWYFRIVSDRFDGARIQYIAMLNSNF